MQRRRFLAVLGLGAAELAACTASGSAPAPSSSVPHTRATGPSRSPGTSAAPRTSRVAPATSRAPRTLQQLATVLDGQVVTHGENGFRAARRAYDPIFDHQRPAAVVRCRSADDVARAVEYGASSGTTVAARSGGHSYAGYSTPNRGIVVDLSALSGVRVDGTSVKVGAGARLIEVYTALGRAGRAMPAGSCPTVGIGGLAQGGGVGVLTRSYGLTCDRLTGAEVVTADGVVHRVSAQHDSDLYWALRGGGGGNVGVVTSFTFSTEPAPDLVKFGLQFPNGTAADVFGAWQDTLAHAPDELNISCSITASDQPYAFVYGTYLGSEPAAHRQVNAFVKRAGVHPNYRQVTAMSVEDAMYSYAKCTGLTLAQAGPSWTGPGPGTIGRSTFVGTSRILRHQVDPAALVGAVQGSNTAVLVDAIDGAAGRVAPAATAFPHRGALATVQIYQGGSDRSAIDAVRTSLGHLMGPYGYVNYIDPAMPDWPRAYYAGNLTRLRSVAKKYDPHRVFDFAQNVNA
ncbi:FAD-binding oxidoreductase [Jatrophihabitans endophyticus]|uniref:FAD-binding oxidoreductase n=1 Tax=Jatrophihabitans endophyticus TaxID=1206085 RepID=UPI0019FB90F2|nr:FAD-binding oxidoreductase [Jatrophihabitans endophyticus]MBE7188640.1 FAD-binding oxidoreductase [Jatrophihabitans endophyticus]